MDPIALPFFGLIIILVGVIAMIIGARFISSGELDERFENFVVMPVRSEEEEWSESYYERRQRELREVPFTRRIIVPIFRRLGGLLGWIVPARSMRSLEQQLLIAGHPLGLHGREFYGIRVLFTVLGVLLGYQVYKNGTGLMSFLLAGFVVIFMFYLPRFWLRSIVRRRQENIRRNLPDALDMLSVCADAGLGFDQSIQRVSEYWDTPLGKEFGRVINEMNMGSSRAQAMRDMAHRLDVSELNSFVAVIIQSDELGMSIADTLHSQANQMRIERRYWAQEQARKIPLKMLFPLLLLILPAMFAVVLGPALPNIMDIFGGL